MGGKRKHAPRPSPPAEKPRPAAYPAWAAGTIFLVVMVAVAYVPALQGGFIWDDDDYVTANPLLDSAEGLRRIWSSPGASPQYYPLVFTGFWIEKHLWGLNPFGYHLVNVLLHALGALLVWAILRRLSLPGAWLAAAVFALHPTQVESVAWITERKNVLSGACYLGALLAYLRFSLPGESDEPSRGRRAWYLVSLALFLAALLSKTTAGSLPAAILLLVWWRRGFVGPRDALPLLPMFLLAALLGLHTAYLERVSVGARGGEWDLSLIQRLLVAGRAAWFYVGKFVWPHPLIFIYPRWRVDAAQWWGYLFPAAAAAVPIFLWTRRRRIGRGPLAAVLFFGGTLLPALGFFDVYPMRYSFVADHFQYLACLGPATLLSAALARNLGGVRAAGVRVFPVAVAVLLAVLGGLTWRQGHAYRNPETLWRDVLSKAPLSALANNNLGRIYNDRGDLTAARTHFERALASKPDFSQAHYNLALVLGRQGDLAGAKGHFESAVRYDDDFADAYAGLGVVFSIGGDIGTAAGYLETARRLKPADPYILTNLGVVYDTRGDKAGARALYERALQLDPGYEPARERLRGSPWAAGSQGAP